MEERKDKFWPENHLKELEKFGPYPAKIDPGTIAYRHLEDFYEASGLVRLLENANIYVAKPLATRIMSAFL